MRAKRAGVRPIGPTCTCACLFLRGGLVLVAMVDHTHVDKLGRKGCHFIILNIIYYII